MVHREAMRAVRFTALRSMLDIIISRVAARDSAPLARQQEAM